MSRGGARVLMVIDSLAMGGAQRHLLSICRALNSGASGIHSSVFALTRADDRFSAELEGAGCEVRFGAPAKSRLHRILWTLRGEMRRQAPTIVHTYLPASYLIGTSMAAALGLRRVLTTVCAREQQIDSPILSFRNYGRLAKLTSAYITSWPQQLLRLGVPEAKIHYSLFANDYATEGPAGNEPKEAIAARLGVAGGYPVLLSVGRLHPHKGHEFAIRAHRRVAERYPGAKLLILGTGEDEQRLRRLAGGNDAGIVFAGVHKDLAPFYSIADAYLNTAVNEGINLSQLQAMAFGVPTIAFDTGKSEYEQAGVDSAVCRVPLEDAAGLGEHVIALLDDPARRARLVEEARSFAARYDSRRVVSDYIAIYEKLCAER